MDTLDILAFLALLIGFMLLGMGIGGAIEHNMYTERLGDMICEEQYGDSSEYVKLERDRNVVVCSQPEKTLPFDGGRTRIGTYND